MTSSVVVGDEGEEKLCDPRDDIMLRAGLSCWGSSRNIFRVCCSRGEGMSRLREDFHRRMGAGSLAVCQGFPEV